MPDLPLPLPAGSVTCSDADAAEEHEALGGSGPRAGLPGRALVRLGLAGDRVALTVTVGGTGLVGLAGRILLRKLAGRCGLTGAMAQALKIRNVRADR